MPDLHEVTERIGKKTHRQITRLDIFDVYEVLLDYEELFERVQELKRYLSLPKFQGEERHVGGCPICGQGTNTTIRISKTTVEVQDIFNRLD